MKYVVENEWGKFFNSFFSTSYINVRTCNVLDLFLGPIADQETIRLVGFFFFCLFHKNNHVNFGIFCQKNKYFYLSSVGIFLWIFRHMHKNFRRMFAIAIYSIGKPKTAHCEWFSVPQLYTVNGKVRSCATFRSRKKKCWFRLIHVSWICCQGNFNGIQNNPANKSYWKKFDLTVSHQKKGKNCVACKR